MEYDCQEFLDFYADLESRKGEEYAIHMMEEICEAICAEKRGERRKSDFDICILDVHKHDVINCTANGSITIDDIEYPFVIEDGNWAGTVVREWGEETCCFYKPTIYKTVLLPKYKNYDLKKGTIGDRPMTALEFKAYIAYERKDPWLDEMAGKIAYDSFFSPCSKTNKYWRDWKDSHSLITDRVEVREEDNE